MKKSFNIQELLLHKSKCHGTKPMHPSSSRAFQRHQEHNLKHPSSVDLVTTKQNKRPSFIDRWMGQRGQTLYYFGEPPQFQFFSVMCQLNWLFAKKKKCSWQLTTSSLCLEHPKLCFLLRLISSFAV